eukprot:GHUV01016285.1.p1 GENE.GHUV01016285.1~~GHUV01016285.1.p1  ORF type:complete len:219 (-),score=24.72 GHUV01016285.1:606-1262(-)
MSYAPRSADSKLLFCAINVADPLAVQRLPKPHAAASTVMCHCCDMIQLFVDHPYCLLFLAPQQPCPAAYAVCTGLKCVSSCFKYLLLLTLLYRGSVRGARTVYSFCAGQESCTMPLVLHTRSQALLYRGIDCKKPVERVRPSSAPNTGARSCAVMQSEGHYVAHCVKPRIGVYCIRLWLLYLWVLLPCASKLFARILWPLLGLAATTDVAHNTCNGCL